MNSASPPTIRLRPRRQRRHRARDIVAGHAVADGVVAAERIPAGHKVAVQPIAAGEPVIRYGQIIGFALADIAPGRHVHVQNCGMGDFAKDYAYSVDARPTDMANDERRSPASVVPTDAWRRATISVSSRA